MLTEHPIPILAARDHLRAAAAALGLPCTAAFLDSLVAVLPDLAAVGTARWGDIQLTVSDGRVVYVKQTLGRQVGKDGPLDKR